MQATKSKAVDKRTGSEPQAPDRRLAAFARLLARHAARQDLEYSLSWSQESSYPADSQPEDEP